MDNDDMQTSLCVKHVQFYSIVSEIKTILIYLSEVSTNFNIFAFIQAFFSQIVRLADSGKGSKTPRQGKRQVRNNFLVKKQCHEKSRVFYHMTCCFRRLTVNCELVLHFSFPIRQNALIKKKHSGKPFYQEKCQLKVQLHANVFALIGYRHHQQTSRRHFLYSYIDIITRQQGDHFF